MIILFLLTHLTLGDIECQSVQGDEVQLPLSLNEQAQTDIADKLLRGKNLQFTIIDDKYGLFKVQQPFHMMDEQPYTGTSIIQKAYRSPYGNQWNNHFAVLNTGYSLSLAFGTHNEFNKAPKFDNQIQLQIDQEQYNCVDFEYIALEKIIVFCYTKSSPIVYQFIVVSLSELSQIKSEYVTNFEQIGKTLLQILFSDSQTYVLIGYPFGQIIENIIDVYLLNNEDQIIYQKELQINNQYEYLQDLKLTDFKSTVHQNIYLLDRIKGIYVFQIVSNQWQFIKKHNPTNGEFRALAIAYDSQLEVYQALIIDKNIIFILVKGYIYQNFYYNEDYLDQNLEIQLTHQFLAIKNYNKVHLIAFEKQTIFYDQSIDIQRFKGFLINPYYREVLLFGSNLVARFIITSGLLIFTPPKEIILNEQSFLLVGTNDVEQCMVQIIYSVFSDNDSDLRQLSGNRQPFSELIYYPQVPQQQFIYTYRMTGPNKQMMSIITGFHNAVVEGSYQRELKFTGITQRTLIYTHIEIDPDKQNNLYIFEQDANFLLIVSRCVYNEVQFKLVCQTHMNVELTYQLTKDIFQVRCVRIVNFFTYILAVGHQTHIRLYKIFGDSLQDDIEQTEEPYTLIQTKSYIRCFIMSQDYVYVLNQDNKNIDVYHIFTRIWLFTIDKALMKSQSYFEDWNPQLLVNNIAMDTNMLIILNKNSIILGRAQGDFQIINILTLQPNIEQVSIQLTPQLLMIVSFVYQGKVYVHEYDISDYYKFLFTKSLPFYEYKPVQPIQLIQNKYTQNIYILSQTLDQKSYCMIVFQAGTYLRDTFMTTIQLDSISDLLVSTHGKYKQFMYIYTTNKVKLLLLTNYIYAELKINYSLDQEFFHDATVESVFYNQESKSKIEYYQQVKFINTHNEIASFQDKVPKRIILENKQILLIDNQWFDGQIFNHSLLVQDNRFKIIQTIEYQKNFTFKSNTKVVDTCEMFGHIVILTELEIIRMTLDLEIIGEPIELLSKQSSKPLKMVCSEDYILLLYSTYEYKNFVSLYYCAGIEECIQIGTPHKPFDQFTITQANIIQNNLVIIQIYGEPSIQFYRLKIESDDFEIIKTVNINNDFLSQKFNPKSMQIQEYTINGRIIYKIFVADYYKGVWIINSQIEQGNLIPSKDSILFLIQNELQAKQLYTTTTTYIQTITTTSGVNYIIRDGLVEQSFYLNIWENYGVEVKFSFNSQNKVTMDITNIFLQTKTYNEIISHSKFGYIANVYDRPYQGGLYIHKIPDKPQTDLRINATKILGAVELAKDIHTSYQFDIFNHNDKIIVIITCDMDTICVYSISDQTRILVEDIEDLSNLKVAAQNDYFKASIDLNLEQPTPVNSSSKYVKLFNILEGYYNCNNYYFCIHLNTHRLFNLQIKIKRFQGILDITIA